MTDHEHWEELAAGHALSALEPAEDEAFLAHLTTCARCQQVLSEHAFVAAQLGTLADDREVALPSWSSMRSKVIAEPAPVSSLDAARERRRSPRLLRVAAGVALLLGTGAGAILLSRQTTSTPPADLAVAACQADRGCHVVRLRSKDKEQGVVLVRGDTVQVAATSMGTPAAQQVYVLWQLPRDGRPTLITAMPDVTKGAVTEAHALVAPYSDTTAFAVSVEPVDTVPTSPGHVVAIGTA